jgi:hypothetical protein
MDEATHRLLVAADDADGAEVPAGDWRAFPYQALAKSVSEVQRALEKELGLRLVRDGNVQDASFHDEIRVLHPEFGWRREGGHLVSDLAIRFSNFGRLYTIFTNLAGIPGEIPIGVLKEIVTRHGWTYVAPEPLEELYDGIHPGFRDGKTTWWIRFFDYL